MEENYQQQLYREMIEYFYQRFDRYIVGKWYEGELDGPITDDIRKRAYKTLYGKVKSENVANRQTIRKWFGIGGKGSTPTRNQILNLVLGLHLSIEEAEEYLQMGISQPGFQVNDYKEFILMYCLEHQIGVDGYQRMVEFYESHCKKDAEWKHEAHTQWLTDKFAEIKDYGAEDFLVWMYKNQAYFKGYSLTMLRTYQMMIEECLEYVRSDNREVLMRTLEPTGFYEWALENGVEKPYEAGDIERFVKNVSRRKENPLSEVQCREIRSLVSRAYANRDRMSDLITELYSTGLPGPSDRRNSEIQEALKDEIHRVDGKYLSELLHTALLKERQMQLQIELSETPDQLQRKVKKEELSKLNQRVHLLQRSDVLILAQYLIYKRISLRIEEEETRYDAEEAREEFLLFGNDILESLGMREINNDYLLDHVLLACFDKEEMYLFAEVLEE
ncbi:MAG: hypothetical protein K6G62_02025 [Eubacterium sp.]|nr:hypothetical protein [Eubacterium sp.]